MNAKKVAPKLSKEVQTELDKIESVSNKIRFLDRQGFTRADISRILNKRYQHVRNVLEEDKKSKSKSE